MNQGASVITWSANSARSSREFVSEFHKQVANGFQLVVVNSLYSKLMLAQYRGRLALI